MPSVLPYRQIQKHVLNSIVRPPIEEGGMVQEVEKEEQEWFAFHSLKAALGSGDGVVHADA